MVWKKNFNPSSERHRFVVTACTMILVPLLIFFQLMIPHESESKILEPKPYTAGFFKILSLGYWPVAVDLMWLKALQYVGSKHFSIENRPHLFQVYELATDIDPEFYMFYEQAGVVFSFFFKNPDDSIYFLNKGIRNRSPRWMHPSTLYLLSAYIHAYEKNDWVKAKESFLAAANEPDSPPYLKEMKNWLKTEGSERELGKRVLYLLMSQTKDENLKKEYLERLKRL